MVGRFCRAGDIVAHGEKVVCNAYPPNIAAIATLAADSNSDLGRGGGLAGIRKPPKGVRIFAQFNEVVAALGMTA